VRVPDLRPPAPVARPAAAGEVARNPLLRAQADSLATAPVAILGDVAVELADVDGIASPGNDDLRGTARGQVAVDRDYLLSQLREFVKSDDKKAITRIAFDARRRVYEIEGHARLFGRFRGPGFKVEMKADGDGHLVVTGRSWADPLLRLFGQPTVADWVERSIRAYKPPVKLQREGRKLIVAGIANLTVPLGSDNIKLTLSDYTPRAGQPGPFSLGADGRVVTALAGEVRGFIWQGKPTGQAEHPDKASLQVHFVARADRSIATRVTGSATVGITEEQLKNLTGQRGEVLFPLLKSGRATFSDLRIEGSYSSGRRWESRITANARVETPQGLTIETPLTADIDDGGKGVTASAGPVAWRDPFNGRLRIERFDFASGADGMRLEVVEPPDKPLDVPFAENRLGLWIGGDAYFQQLLAAVGQAREGVLLESFGYPGGQRPEKLMEALLNRAARGVAVRLLIDPGPFGTEDWAGRVKTTLAGNGDDAWTKRFMAGLTGAELARIRESFDVVEHPGGLARTNHRKVVVVDGVLGVTGGVNVGDGHFSTVQDAMVPVVGPAARDLAEAFLRTWAEDGGKVTDDDRRIFVKDDAAITAEGGARFGGLVGVAPAKARMLVTDDRQAEIARAYLDAIDGARKAVKVEQQYLTERAVVAALARAIRRGVDVTVVVPEDQGNEFELGNNLAILRLLEASAATGAGSVDARYYQTRGTWTHHVHSKILVADGERALVGSANVDQRAMRGLATTAQGRILWNKELDLDIADPAFAGRIDREVFGRDTRPEESRDVWEKLVATRLEAPAKRNPADMAKLGLDLRTLMHEEAATAIRSAGDSPAEREARTRLEAALARAEGAWDATWSLAATPDVDRVEFVKARIPAGRGRDVELHMLRHPGGQAAWARAAAHAALYGVERAVADLYRAGGFKRHEAFVRAALRPDERQARLSDAFNLLF